MLDMSVDIHFHPGSLRLSSALRTVVSADEGEHHCLHSLYMIENQISLLWVTTCSFVFVTGTASSIDVSNTGQSMYLI